MNTTVLVYGFVFLGIAAFLIGVVIRAVSYARMPFHLRWELYPIPHENPNRVRHGGSYFEEMDWWKHERPFNWFGEFRAMLTEMLFLKGLREFNRKLWYRSFPFHFGLYLLAASGALLFFSVIMGLLNPHFAMGVFDSRIQLVGELLSWGGSILVLWGALGLLHRRLTDENLKNYTSSADIFNLLFFIVTMAVFVMEALLRKPGLGGFHAFTRGLLTVDTSLQLSPLFTLGAILAATLVGYIPYTHMSHFIGKFFTYHSVRWNDSPMLREGNLEKKMAEYLTYRPTWSASHVGADGQRTWVDLASTNPVAAPSVRQGPET